MLQAEILANTSGQTAVCRRLYSATLSGLRPITIAIRCMIISRVLGPDFSGKFRDAAHGDCIPIPLNADTRLRWSHTHTVLDCHAADYDFIELGNILNVLSI